MFRERYTGGYGADGDHLKHAEDIREALDCGYTMITLDLSEHIRPADSARRIRPDDTFCKRYLGKSFLLADGSALSFSVEELSDAVTIYDAALDFTRRIYHDYFASGNYRAELEISIDETAVATTPLQHFFVTSELRRRGVQFATIAPRFTGEFQKGIDYIGDVGRFAEELAVHQAIADTFGYKLSVHSGSDKFSVFPTIGRITGGRFHIKTSGTSWLEAMRLVAMEEPALYRAIHRYSLSVFEKAQAYYSVSADIQTILNVDALTDAELPTLFDTAASRQLIHITYGFILSHPVFAPKLRQIWSEKAALYEKLIAEHITRHMEALQIPTANQKNAPAM